MEYNETLHALAGNGAKKEKDVTCFRLLAWAAKQEDMEAAFVEYRETMQSRRPCPLIETCPSAAESRRRGHRWPWQVTKGLPLFDAVENKTDASQSISAAADQ